MKPSGFWIFMVAAALVLTTEARCEDRARKGEEPSTVLARVGDRVITVFDLEQALIAIPQEHRQEFSTPQGRKNLLQKLIDLHLFEMEARRIGLHKDPAIQAQAAIIERNFLSRQLVLHYIRNQWQPPSEEDLRAYYKENISDFTQPEEVLARHILVRTKKEAEEILVLLKNGGDFAQLARERSIAPDAERGGLLGWFARGKMLPSFEKAAFALEKGEVSDAVWTKYGYHIILVEDRKPASAKPYEAVKNDIYSRLVKSMQEEAVQSLRETLLKKVKVEILDQRYALDSQKTPKP
jgi:peptidyl-prolyl cis-trans isomerase C